MGGGTEKKVSGEKDIVLKKEGRKTAAPEEGRPHTRKTEAGSF